MTIDVQGNTGRWGTHVDTEREAVRRVLAGEFVWARFYDQANILIGEMRRTKRKGRHYIDFIRDGKITWSRTV